MSNMSYCRFNNTVSDLNECAIAIEQVLDGSEKYPISDEEMAKSKELISTALEIILNLAQEGSIDLDELDSHTAVDKLHKVFEDANQAIREARS